MTRLREPLQRPLSVGGNLYTPTVDPDGFERVEKQRGKAMSRMWAESREADAALAAALQASAAERSR